MSAAPGPDPDAPRTLAASRLRSAALIAALSARLDSALHGTDAIVTVAAAGSLGRLEVSAGSDLDAIVIVADRLADGAAPAADVYAALAHPALKMPKPAGIFRRGVSAAALCAPQGRGALDEAPALFGKRIQCLLDTRPLFGASAFADLQTRILDWYGADRLRLDPHGQWTLLIHDLQRYLHSYAAWQQHKFERDDEDGWYLRQAKLRSSRLLTFAGLLLLLGASSRRHDKPAWLQAHLALTPLERIARVMREIDAAAFDAIESRYAAVHALLADPAQRAALVAQSPTALDEVPTRWPEPYAEIHRHTGEMLLGLTHFVLARRDDWHPDFFSELMF